MEIKWDDVDPNTGKRRYVKAERFAGAWTFFCRRERRSVWEKWSNPSREMWEALLESLERRSARQEATELDDIKLIKKQLDNWREPPSV